MLMLKVARPLLATPLTASYVRGQGREALPVFLWPVLWPEPRGLERDLATHLYGRGNFDGQNRERGRPAQLLL